MLYAEFVVLVWQGAEPFTTGYRRGNHRPQPDWWDDECYDQMAVAQQSAELVQEVGAEAPRTVQVAGRAVSVITLMLCAAAIWFIARAVLNRLVHALKGNSISATLVELVGGEATFAVKGKRSQVMHKVWVRLDSKQSACGCKAYTFRKGRAGAAMPPSSLPSRWVWCVRTWPPQLRRCCGARLAGDRKGARRPSASTSTAVAVPAPAAAAAAQGPGAIRRRGLSRPAALSKR